jgi:hypothetical protein
MLSTVIMRFAPLRIGPLRFLEITQKVVVGPKTTVKPCVSRLSAQIKTRTFIVRIARQPLSTLNSPMPTQESLKSTFSRFSSNRMPWR